MRALSALNQDNFGVHPERKVFVIHHRFVIRSYSVTVEFTSKPFFQNMPARISSNSLQRELADSIIRMVPLDEIRILLACGAKVN